MAGASIEAGVTKCVRLCWGRQRGVRGRRGGSGFFIVVQSGEGRAKPKEAAHRDVNYEVKILAWPCLLESAAAEMSASAWSF